ncbi:MAG: sigma-70 family RNA polymerase sigma factor [Bacteroidota bacterium]
MKANEIITRIREGDERVISQTYRRYREEFIRWMKKKYASSDEEGRDYYQEAFCRFLIQVQSGKLTHITSTIKTYLFGIGRNVFGEQQRKNTRFDREIDEEKIADHYELKLQKEEKEIEYQLIESNLEKLDKKTQDLILMFYYQNRSMEYIAEKLNYKNAASAKNQKYKCIIKLRKTLESYKIRRAGR